MEKEVLGYFKLDGELVKDGFMDAKTSSEFLLGLDEVVRLLVHKQVPDLKDFDFEIPVRVNKGSWEALVGIVVASTAAVGGAFALSYAKEAGKRAAENDWKDGGLKDVIKKSMEGVQWLIRIGKHQGDLTKKKFDDAIVKTETNEVGIRNADGVVLFIPKEFFDLYTDTPARVLSKVSAAIEVERKLVVGVKEEKGTFVDETVTMTQKYIFTQVEDDRDVVLFPEMVHDMPVELIGLVTRGNATANNMGFRYQEHILTCNPEKGSITKYKYAMFSKCRIVGRVDRRDEHGSPTAKRPKIEFTELIPMDPEVQEPPLLSAN
jgi:hypothetical protein